MTMDHRSAARSEKKLIALLRLAYSGELAAAHAYRGHWKSVRDPGERDAIRTIEEEEWKHRREVGELLVRLGSGPSKPRDLFMGILGRALGFACHFSGWFFPMYGAGRLETKNVHEYDDAARYAEESGHHDMVAGLRAMSALEHEHELYFAAAVARHALGRIFRLQLSSASAAAAASAASPGEPGRRV